jgi:hypothetical protein
MSDMNKLVEDAKKAIKKVFCDTTVTPDVTMNRLEELRDEITEFWSH